MELRLLFDVIVVLNIAAFLHQWVFLGNGTGARPLCGGLFLLVFRWFLSNCRLATFHNEAQNHWYRVFFDYKLTNLERGSNKLLTKRFCSKLSSVKCLTQMRECFEDMKHSLFTFVSHSFLSFGSWGNLEVLTFDFEWFSSESHYKSETKAVSNFPNFLNSPTVTSQVLFSENYPTIFPTALRLWRIKTLNLTFQCLRNASSNSIETSEYFYTSWTHWTLKKRMSKFWFIQEENI